MNTKNKSQKIYYLHLWPLFCLLLFLQIAIYVPQAKAQEKIQVVTRTIEKELEYRRGMELKVNAEKATVDVKGWDKNFIKIKVRLIAKHPEKAVAEAELDYLKFGIVNETNQLILYNNFNVPRSAGNVKSNLKAHYEILVPENSTLYITNKYGDINYSNLNADVKTEIEFGNLVMNNVSGKSDITSKFADIRGTKLDLILKCVANKADISMQEIEGAYDIKSSYGRIDLGLDNNISYIKINSNRSEIAVTTNGFANYNYGLSTQYSDIFVPGSEYERYKKSSSGSKTFNYESGKKNSTITITTSYSPITIR